MDDMLEAEIRCFLSTTKKAIRYYSHCPVTIEPVLLHNLWKWIAWVLVKKFRAGIPAGPAAHAGHAIDHHIHLISSRSIGIHIVGRDHKGNEYCCSLAKAQSQAINISSERDFLFFCISAWRYAGTGMPGKLSNRDYCWIKSSVIFDLRCWCVYPVPICTKLINSCKLQFKFTLGLIIWRNFKLPFVITTTIWYQWHGYGQMVMGMQYINARTVGEKCRRETAPARGNGSPLLTNLILPV